MNLIQSLILKKPDRQTPLMIITLFIGVLSAMLFGTWLPVGFQIIGFILGGFVIGLSYALGRNIVYPISLIMGYNLLVIGFRSIVPELAPIFKFEEILVWIGEGIYITFIVFWVSMVAVQIHTTINKDLEKKEFVASLSLNKMILGSVIAGILFGLLMEIRAI